MDDMCGGHLPEPAEHDGDFNHHRFCLNGVADNGGVFDLQVNNSDLQWFRWLFDALDGKNTANMNSPEQAAKDLLVGFNKGLEGEELFEFARRSFKRNYRQPKQE